MGQALPPAESRRVSTTEVSTFSWKLTHYRNLHEPMWGSQSWLQPPFEAAPRATAETDPLWQTQELSSDPQSPERRLNAAQKGGGRQALSPVGPRRADHFFTTILMRNAMAPLLRAVSSRV